jgi:hypothetical protein
MKKSLFVVRSEADFERVVTLAISGKYKYQQHFVFTGDFSPFFEDGIQNIFQKKLFNQHGFMVRDFCSYDLIGRILKILCNGKRISFDMVREKKRLIIPFVFFKIFQKYIQFRKHKIVEKIIDQLNVKLLLTDQSTTGKDYLPEIIRQAALNRKIPVYLFTHGAAGGLHREFSYRNFNGYENYTMLACSNQDVSSDLKRKIILGDMSSSYTYVKYINSLNIQDINFLNEKKYKVAFIVGGAGLTYTSGWSIQEEIIIELSENKDVAMVLKLHPREAPFIDLRMLKTFKNLLIVNKDCDRSRVTKWADIIVCSDTCSTIFEPMILGKKVVAIEGKRVPKYKSKHSPIINSSVLHIQSAKQFSLKNIPNANPTDPITNEFAWGSNGNVDLAELFYEKIR